MKEFRRVLDERRSELDSHLAFISQLEASATGHGPSAGATVRINTDSINILKSGLLLHLYNIVEAVMAKVLEEIALAAQSHVPRNWCDGLLQEWAVGRVNLSRDILIQSVEMRIVQLLHEAVERSALTQVSIRRRSGNWSDEEIVKLATALQCTLSIAEPIKLAACETEFEDQRPPMNYLRHMRNQLAHGNMSFVEGARHLPSARLQDLRDSVVNYMMEVADAFDQYIDNRSFLLPQTT